jgi:hypothetical protein
MTDAPNDEQVAADLGELSLIANARMRPIVERLLAAFLSPARAIAEARLAKVTAERDEALERLSYQRAISQGHDARATTAEARADRLTAERDEAVKALTDARENGLIYWEPNTDRGYVAKAQMLARIDTVLASIRSRSEPSQ